MKSTLVRYYLYSLLSGLQFGWTTWLAFVVAKGGNPGWAESAYHLAILLGEVPTGILADFLGRRRSMLIGLVVGGLASFGYLLIDGTWTACLVLALSGFGSTFLSGADSALLYETADEIGGAEYARKATARASAIFMASLAVAPVIAGWLYEQAMLAPFLSRGVLSFLTIAVVWGMVERRPERPATGRPDLLGHTKTAVRLVLANKPVLFLMLFSWGYNAVGAMTAQFAQVYLPAIGLTMVGAGVVFSLGRLVGSFGGWLAERISSAAATRWLRYGPLAHAAAYMAMGFSHRWPGAATFIGGDFLDGVIYPTLLTRVNERIPSEQRATILSFQSLGFSLLMTITFPAATYLPSIHAIYLVTGGAGIALALVWMRLSRQIER